MSIATQKMNSRARFTQHLIEEGVLVSSPLTVIDVGARGGFEKHWGIFANQVELIGFELDADECVRLNEREKNSQKKYYPVALDRKKGKRKFYVQPHLASSSFYESNAQYLSRFPASRNMLPVKTVMVPTIDLDTFAKENKRKNIDFIKLDAEGAELDVFKGAQSVLKNSVFGLTAEAVFFPWRHKIPTFTDIDIFLTKRGFKLYDLPIMRWERKSLSPYMFTEEEKTIFGPTDRGQVVWTQAVYFKDAVAEMRSSKVKRAWWNKNRILKLASLFELYNLEDCAIELIQEAVRWNIIDKSDATKFIDLLTPQLDGRDVTYAEYTENIKRMGPPRYIDGKRVSQQEFEEYQNRKKQIV